MDGESAREKRTPARSGQQPRHAAGSHTPPHPAPPLRFSPGGAAVEVGVVPHERDALLRQAAEVLCHERGVVVDLRVPPAETAAEALLSAHRHGVPGGGGMGGVGAHSSTMMDRMWGGAANTGATRHAAATRRRIIIAPVCADCEGQATAADRPRTASWQSRIVARQAVGAAAALLARTPTPKLPTPNANGMRILVVQAHPHDFTFCGGTCGIHVARGS